LGAALLEFRDFAMERVDMVLGSVGSRRRMPGARYPV
jgi:hypothetical protein